MTELLSDHLTGEKKALVVEDCLTLIDQEVAGKGGLTGMALKAGYAAVKGVKPGFIKTVVNDLIPEFAKALEPLYAEAKSKSEPIGAYLPKNGSRAADALLAITDEKAKKSKNGLVKGTYERLRGTAKKHVEDALPRLGTLIEKYAG